MSILGFLPERRVLIHGARRFVVGPPTVAAGHSILLRFGPEIRACAKAFRTSPAMFAGDPVGIAVAAFISPADPRLGECLHHCVEMEGAAPGDLEQVVAADHELATKLVFAVFGLCDLPRIVRSLGLEQLGAEGQSPEPEGVSDGELQILRAAEIFGIDPRAVLDWPIEMLVSVTEAYSARFTREGIAASAPQQIDTRFVPGGVHLRAVPE